MKVKIKFLTQIMKNGVLRKPGDTIEVDATTAILLAEKKIVEIMGYDIKKVEKTVIEKVLVPNSNKK